MKTVMEGSFNRDKVCHGQLLANKEVRLFIALLKYIQSPASEFRWGTKPPAKLCFFPKITSLVPLHRFCSLIFISFPPFNANYSRKEEGCETCGHYSSLF